MLPGSLTACARRTVILSQLAQARQVAASQVGPAIARPALFPSRQPCRRARHTLVVTTVDSNYSSGQSARREVNHPAAGHLSSGPVSCLSVARDAAGSHALNRPQDVDSSPLPTQHRLQRQRWSDSVRIVPGEVHVWWLHPAQVKLSLLTDIFLLSADLLASRSRRLR